MGSREAIARALMDLPAGVVRWASAPAERLPRVSSGIATLDAALGGGWPKGRVATLQARFATGLATGGATAIAASSVADATARGLLAAWIDGDGSLDPASLAAAGADLERVLWVRGPLPADRVLSAAEEVLRAGGFDVLVLRLPRGPRRLDAAWARLDAAWARVSRAAAAARAAP
ncbi:MAG: hypothetical protein FJ087_18585, partial [Deltaproteobacteria bacterium]|nr:hypothetical protein [Deltaproteobacteria bacterium]